MNALATEWFLTICLVVFALSCAAYVIRYPRQGAILAATCLLIFAFFGKAHAATAEVAVITDSSDVPQATVEHLLADASYLLKPAGVTLRLVSIQQRESFDEPDASPVVLLDALKAYRNAQPLPGADVYVLLTTRVLTLGRVQFAGRATPGPSCGSDASAVLSLQGDGNDGIRLAHQLAHTLGAEDDGYGGFLMDRAADTVDVGYQFQATGDMSQDTLGVLRGIQTDCMRDPLAVKPDASVTIGGAPAPTGGNGSFSEWGIAALMGLCWLVHYLRARRRWMRVYQLAHAEVCKRDRDIIDLEFQCAARDGIISGKDQLVATLRTGVRIVTDELKDCTTRLEGCRAANTANYDRLQLAESAIDRLGYKMSKTGGLTANTR